MTETDDGLERLDAVGNGATSREPAGWLTGSRNS